MGNSAPAAGSAPAPETPPAAPTAEQLATDLPKFGTDELDQLLEAPPAETPAPAAPASAAPAAPAAAPETPKPDEDDEGADDLQPKAIKVKPADFREQEVLRLMKPRDGSKGLSLQDAYARVYGNEPAKKADEPAGKEPAAPEAPKPDPVAAEITASETRLAEIEKQIAKAADDMDVVTVAKLTREATKLEAGIERLKERVESTKQQAAQTAEQTFRQTQQQYTKQAVELYPALSDKENPDRAEFDAFIKAKYDDPEFAPIFDSPRWPLVLAKEFAEVKGWTPAKTERTAAAPAKGQAAPVSRQPAAPAARATAAAVIVPGAEGSGTVTPTKEDLLAKVSTLSAKELDALLAGAPR